MKIQQIVDEWNTSVTVGTLVTVTKDNGDEITTRTRSQAWILGEDAVILVEGISGGYLLERVRKAGTP